MIPFLLLLATSVAVSTPQPLTQTHMRDIACVAVIGLVAHDQREGLSTATQYPDFRESGRKWAGIVGSRVTEQTGQPREIIASEIQSAVEREQRIVKGPGVTEEMKNARVRDCAALMNAELLSPPLPKPVKAAAAKP
jgi:D-alanyl-D-alanine carboxypeptidase